MTAAAPEQDGPTWWRKRPAVVPMVTWTGDNLDDLDAFTLGLFRPVDPCDRWEDPEVTAEVFDRLHSTWVGVKTGQSVVRGVLGEFYPLDDEARARSFDPVRKPVADTANWQLVGGTGNGEVTVTMPRARMTREQALVHAAWLVLVADGEDGFADYLDAVKGAS